MKKKLIYCFLAVFVLTGMWAQNAESVFSAGFGIFTGGDLGGGLLLTFSDDNVPYEAAYSMPYFGGGVYIFFDAKYLEASLGYFRGGGTRTWKLSSNGVDMEATSEKIELTSLNNGLLFKYPFSITDNLVLFPALGVNYQSVLSLMIGNTYAEPHEFLNAIWFQFGGGLDYHISRKLYLRLKVLYALRPKTNLEISDIEDYYYMYKNIFEYSDVNTEGRLGHGPNINLALGFKL
jgi:hypothetical protein